MKNIFLAVFLSVTLAASASAQRTKFDYLKVSGDTVTSIHDAKFKIVVNKKFKYLGKLRHQETYSDKQFNITMAAYTDGPHIAMIHAEKHTDGSGGLDYSKLKTSKLFDGKFTVREQCAGPEDDTELRSNPQLVFLRSKGFDVKTPFYLRQFFTTDRDGKAELVLSYGRRVSSCEGKAITEEFRNTMDAEAGKVFDIRKLK